MTSPATEAPAKAATFLTAEWRHLAMLNYEVDPEILAARVPDGTELDSWRGRTFVSLVGFRFLDTRVLGVPIPFHRDFDEVNLRFYVRRHHVDGNRRGVVFVKEIVPRRAIAWVARNVYNESYVALPMRHRIALPQVGYEWRHRGSWHRLEVTCAGEASLAADDSEETFITEHYWGYAKTRDGATLEYRVEHPRWPVWQSSAASLDGDVGALYGAELGRYLTGEPSSAFVAVGSGVSVHKGAPL
jgi:uncharacterized protein YqjF (DUF2071 family)